VDLKVDRSLETPIHVQIASQIRELILTRQLPEGQRLPPSRLLGRQLGVHRSTILQVYNRLWSEGLIEGHVGRGTIVRKPRREREAGKASPSWNALFASRLESLAVELPELARLLNRSGVISLAAGFPAPDLYPLEGFSGAVRYILDRNPAELVQPCDVEGYLPLRTWIAGNIMGGIPTREVLILSGSQQGLSLLGQALVEPGDTVVVESPTYLGALQVFKAAGARLIGVPAGDGGIDLDILENLLQRIQPKLLYVQPTFQNPTGCSMGLEGRRRLLDLAGRYRIPIVEDDTYGLLRYEGETLPTLRSLDQYGCVLHLGTFSKILFPGLRVAWLSAPVQVIERLAPTKGMVDLFTNTPSQVIASELCSRGLLHSHLEEAKSEYQRRRDLMATALARECPGMDWLLPHGGCSIWCRLPGGVSGRDLLREALSEGVSFVTGEIFYLDGRGKDHIRLSFASEPPNRLEEGVRRLGKALRRVQSEADRARSFATEGFNRPIV
jgi:2-aminoadipate transaminase